MNYKLVYNSEVFTEEEAKIIQDILFLLGFTWSEERIYKHLNKYIFIPVDGRKNLSQSTTPTSVYYNTKQITDKLREAFNHD